MLLLKQNRDVYLNEGAYSTGVLIDKKNSRGVLIREGALIGRKAANRIIMESSEKYNIRCKI